MISEHRYHEVIDGKTHYAYVCVMIKLNTPYSECTSIFSKNENDNIPSSWIMSALEGIVEAAGKGIKKGLVDNLTIRLISLNGTETETETDLVKCAAINAVWKVISPKHKPLRVAYKNKTWSIEYPKLGLAS